MCAAAGLVTFFGPDEDDRIINVRGLSVDQALGAAGGFAADSADCVQLCHFFSYRHQCRKHTKGLAAKVRIQSGDEDPPALVGKVFDQLKQPRIKKLGFVNGNHRRFRMQQGG